MSTEIFTYKTLAEYLHISIPTLRRYVSQRKIPFTKIGKSVRFTKTQVEEILKGGSK